MEYQGHTVRSQSFRINERWLVFGLLVVYLTLCIIWEFQADAPWDDDCISRYYNARDAIHNPHHFISLWNRPLCILLFFIPFQISHHTILLMAIISASSAYALFLALKELKISNSFMIIPLLTFQAFFFAVSRSALAEPLAAAIIAFGFLFYQRKQFLNFALIGSLLPLARLELSVILVFWVYILIINKKLKYVLLLGVPTLLWSLAGTLLDGDLFWLYERTIGKETVENIYGHKSFWHYFHRYIYVIGPVVFYFFFIGLFERVYKRKVDVFVIGQFIAGFFIYVLFSWKLNLGQAAGFLRHLIALSPLTSILALYGYNYWLESVSSRKKQITTKPEDNYSNQKELMVRQIDEIIKQANEKNLPKRQKRYLINKEKRKFEEWKIKIKKEQEQQEKTLGKAKRIKYRILLYSGIMVGLSLLFFSKKLLNHHSISEITDFTNVGIIGAITVIFLFMIFLHRKKQLNDLIRYGLAFIFICSIMGHTLITEPPNIHDNPERETMGKISDLYMKGYLKNYKTYVNHSWFFWSNGLDRDYNVYQIIKQENLKQAPDSSIIIWENHYSHRLAGDVQLEFFKENPGFLELFNMISSDKTFLVVIYQKIKQDNPNGLINTYNRFIEFAPKIPSAYLNRANVKFNKLKNYNEAIHDYNKVIMLDSNYIDAYFNKGLANFNLRKFNDAISDFTKSTELKPDYYQAHYNIGITKSNLGDFTNAIDNYSRAIELKEDYYEAFFNRGNAYSSLKDFDNAIADYKKVIEYKPVNYMAYYRIGVIKNDLEDFPDAINNYSKAIAVKADYYPAYFNRAMVYSKLEKFENAIADYTKVIEFEPRQTYAYYNRGIILLQLGQRDKACQDFQKAGELGHQYANTLFQQLCKR